MPKSKDFVLTILISTDWDIQHRKHLLKEVFIKTSEWADIVVVQQPVCIIGHFITKFRRKIIGLLIGDYKTKIIESGAVLFTPIIIFNYALWLKIKIFAEIDTFLMSYQLNRFLSKNYHNQKIVLNVFHPSHYVLLKKMQYDYLIYDFYDNFDYDSQGEKLVLESRYNDLLIKKCNLILCLSHITYNRAKILNKNTYFLRSGNNFKELSKNYDNVNPPELENIKTPIVGYLGNIRDWMDFDLLDKLICTNKDVTFVFIGFLNRDSKKQFKMLLKHHNAKWIPYLQQELVSPYLFRFSAGLIPFKTNKFMEGVFPNKFLEYLSAGVPVITTQLPELIEFKDIIGYASNHDDFIKYCKDAIDGNYNKYKNIYIKIAKENTWEKKSLQLNEVLKDMVKQTN